MKKIEWLGTGLLVIAVAVPLLLGVLDARRRAEDMERVSTVRQAQAALEAYRAREASYPERADALRSDDAELVQALGYEARPSGCAAAFASPCLDYHLAFVLRGALGRLPGGTCTASAQGLSCAR